MMKFLMLALVAMPASGIVMRPKDNLKQEGKDTIKQKGRHYEILPSTTRDSKAVCKEAKALTQGKWVALNENEVQEAPQGKNSEKCNAELMMWEPTTCKLPLKSEEIPQKSGRVVFIGDSVSEGNARSFAWYDGKQTKSLQDCKIEKEEVKHRLGDILKTSDLKHHGPVIEYIEEAGFRKNHHWWGCNSSVAYISSDMPPPKQAAKGFLYAVQHFFQKPLGPEDTIVLNWGAWQKEDWGPQINSFMKEYANLVKDKTAPKLIWREMSPMHWGPGSWYSKAAFKQTQTTESCSPAGKPEKLDMQYKNEHIEPLSHNLVFEKAVKQAGLEIDGTNIELLPIWRASAERFEDHRPLSKWEKKNRDYNTDCTHFCMHGNVHRFWNSAILNTISSMKHKEAK